jgi:beta-mannosidase
MAADLLAAAGWTCCWTEAGAATTPDELATVPVSWIGTEVPGTAAAAVRAAGGSWETVDFDGKDWWFRTVFDAGPSPGPFLLGFDGVATLADAWLNGAHVWQHAGMFTADTVEVAALAPVNELVVRCRALSPVLAARSRAHWRTRLVAHQALRSVRTTLLGRIPAWAGEGAPVGPWRPVTLRPVVSEEPLLISRRLAVSLISRQQTVRQTGSGGDEGEATAGDGIVAVELTVRSVDPIAHAAMRVGESHGPLAVTDRGDGWFDLAGTVRVAGVRRWWPHTHGDQPRYPVDVEIGGTRFDLGAVGFRTVDVDRAGDGFTLVVNGSPVFCRGACWVPPDPVSLVASRDDVRRGLAALRDANMNMVRLTGTMVYENADFFDLCDELGILVWQDCMLANLEPPEDPDFGAQLAVELEQQLGLLQGHPSVAVVSGGSEIEQQAAMAGAARAHWVPPVLADQVKDAVERALPGTPYVTSTPTGGDLPFVVDRGVAHYFGVGAYRRPLDDARRAGVRFAAECLAFATPPESQAVDRWFGGPEGVGHHPRWKEGVPRDAGTGWDFEDVRDHYVQSLFGVDPLGVRYGDPARYLDLGRAAVATCMTAVFSEWRRQGSGCGGGIVLSLRDLRPGAGWGLLDAAGRPKAPWYALRRALAPVGLVATDEGLNGLRLYVVNEACERLVGELEVELIGDGERCLEQVSSPVDLEGRGQLAVDVSSLFDGFRDLTYAYRFGPPVHDVVVVTLRGSDGEVRSELSYLPLGQGRPVEHDLGLTATARPGVGDQWVLECSTRRFAQWVSVDVPGFVPDDSWFDLPPGRTRRLGLRPVGDRPRPRGAIRAINAVTPGTLDVEGGS